MSVKPSGCSSLPIAADQCETVYHGSVATQRLQSWHSSRGTVLEETCLYLDHTGPSAHLGMLMAGCQPASPLFFCLCPLPKLVVDSEKRQM